MNNQQLTNEEKKILKKERGVFITTKTKINKLIEPRLFKLTLEGVSNVRNSIIIAGALATMNLLIINTFLKDNLFINQLALYCLYLSTIGFLITIISYSLSSKNNLEDGIKTYLKKLKEEFILPNKGLNAINNCLEGKISKEVVFKEISEIYKEIELKKLRTAGEDIDFNGKIFYSAIIGNYSFIMSIILLILALLIALITLFQL